jgi:hypothetical protein
MQESLLLINYIFAVFIAYTLSPQPSMAGGLLSAGVFVACGGILKKAAQFYKLSLF